jgi:hypothetical protein
MNALRKTLPPLPAHMQSLPIDERGYPIPWFVSWIDGKPDFRLLDEENFRRAFRENRCTVCGKPLGRFKSFVGGPMNVIQLISGEPPLHRQCALFSVKACPFLLLPLAKRRMNGITEETLGGPGDVFVEENPGITSIYTCTRFRPGASGVFHFGDITSLEWFTQGREATEEEIREALHRARDRLVAIQSNAETNHDARRTPDA